MLTLYLIDCYTASGHQARLHSRVHGLRSQEQRLSGELNIGHLCVMCCGVLFPAVTGWCSVIPS